MKHPDFKYSKEFKPSYCEIRHTSAPVLEKKSNFDSLNKQCF